MLLFRLRSSIDKVPSEPARKRLHSALKEARPQLLIALACALFLLLDATVKISGGISVLTGIAWILFVAAGAYTVANYGSVISDLKFFSEDSLLLNGTISHSRGDAKWKIFTVEFTTGDRLRCWETGLLDAALFREGQSVRIAWRDGYLQYAALLLPDGKPERLARSFTRKISDSFRPDFSALHCPSCGGAVPVSENEKTACPFCGAAVEIPARYREAFAAAETIAGDNHRIVAEWKSLSAIRISNFAYRLLNSLPFLLIAAGMVMLLLDSLELLDGDAAFLRLLHQPAVKMGYWAFVVLITITGAIYSSRNLWANDTRSMMAFFAARRPENPHHPFSCRNCGSALAVRTNEAYCVCPYCHTENFILPGMERMSNLQERKENFAILLEDTVQLCRLRKKNGQVFSFGRALALGLMALPLYFLYNSNGIRQPDAWTFAIAVDVWALGICAYWIFREAWLPPVQDTDWLPAAFAEAQPENKNTRAQNDFSMQKQNFLVPLLLVLIYVAAEILAGTK